MLLSKGLLPQHTWKPRLYHWLLKNERIIISKLTSKKTGSKAQICLTNPGVSGGFLRCSSSLKANKCYSRVL